MSTNFVLLVNFAENGKRECCMMFRKPAAFFLYILLLEREAKTKPGSSMKTLGM